MRRVFDGLTLLLALTGGTACRSNGDRPDVPSGPVTSGVAAREVELAPGQSTRVNGLTVTFEGVSADSRCPIGVQCVWEGDAVVVVSVREPSREGAALELHTAGRFPREGTYGRYRIQLVSLVPQPREGEPVASDRYRTTLRITAE